jgi:hypothetical protein
MKQKLPTRRMREHPDLEQLKRQAKELLREFAAGEAEAPLRLPRITASRTHRNSRCTTLNLWLPEVTALRAGPNSRRMLTG